MMLHVKTTNEIFTKIVSDMYLWTRKNWLRVWFCRINHSPARLKPGTFRQDNNIIWKLPWCCAWRRNWDLWGWSVSCRQVLRWRWWSVQRGTLAGHETAACPFCHDCSSPQQASCLAAVDGPVQLSSPTRYTITISVTLNEYNNSNAGSLISSQSHKNCILKQTA